jgi:Reverse transcriptase (RNA-dependent DNA polymerase)
MVKDTQAARPPDIASNVASTTEKTMVDDQAVAKCQKQAGQVWYKHLSQGLSKLGFQQSLIDACVFYRKNTVFLVYVDDGIIAGPDKGEIEQVIVDLKTMFKVSDEGDLTGYLGVNNERQENETIKLSQPHLIDQIIEDANFQVDTKLKATPAAATKILDRDEGGGPHNDNWHYRGIIGKLNFLENQHAANWAKQYTSVHVFVSQQRSSILKLCITL